MTIRELAAKLGVSKSTVAAALRDNPAIRAETRAWIRQKARELGYEPNPVASAFLQQVRTRSARRYRANLLFLSAWKGSSSRLFKGASERAAQLGYHLDRINREEGAYDAKSLTRILQARGILGLAIAPQKRPLGHLTLNWSQFASVAVGYSLTRPAINRVVHNHLQGIRLLFRICQRRGFRRIGLVFTSPESDLRSNGCWLSGYLGIQQKLPVAQRMAPLMALKNDGHEQRIRKWLKKEKPEVAIFHTASSIPPLPEFEPGRPGSAIPLLLDRAPADPYAGIDQQYESWGALTIDLLSLQILHNQRGIPLHPTLTMVDGSFVDHPSFSR